VCVLKGRKRLSVLGVLEATSGEVLVSGCECARSVFFFLLLSCFRKGERERRTEREEMQEIVSSAVAKGWETDERKRFGRNLEDSKF